MLISFGSNGNGHSQTPLPTLDEYRPDERSAFRDLPAEDDTGETLEEARRRIAVRYGAMSRLAAKLVQGRLPSIILSGPAGMGKSTALDTSIGATNRARHDGVTPVENDATALYDHISGGCSAPGLYHALWNMRKGGVLLVDDCDTVFHDEESVNLLKIATDSTKKRLCSWRKKAAWLDVYGIERTFDFQGHIAFLTNIDFEREIEKNNKNTEHFKALIDRARYLCLTLRTQRDFMIRLRQVAMDEGMLRVKYGLDNTQAETIFEFIEENKMRFYNLSIRLIEQTAQEMLTDPDYWRENIEATKMRTT